MRNVLGLSLIRRTLCAPARQEAVTSVEGAYYEGRVHITPTDEYGEGVVWLVSQDDLVSYIYEQLDVPSEDGIMPDVSLHARITVEVLPDPDMNGWPG